MKESIGDVDLLVAADEAAPIMDYFVNMPRVESVSGHGPTKSSVVLHNGMQVDLRVLPAERWGHCSLTLRAAKTTTYACVNWL